MIKNNFWDVVVVGGGPAGMMCAGRAAERGKKVLLLEKNTGLGKKLLITGGGRCNITNNKPDVRNMLSKYKGNDKFLFSAFSQFAVTEAMDFFDKNNLKMKEENEGRMFPVTNKAQSVWDALVGYMKKGGVEVKSKAQVTEISKDKKSGNVVLTLSDKTKIETKSCVVATGGTSRPETGSTGDGFLWLKKLGHTIIKNDVSLVPIALRDSWVKKLAGVSLPDIKLTTYKNKTKQKAYKGKILFTHFGISGPTVLNMSRDVGQLLEVGEGQEYIENKNAEVVIFLDMFPSLDEASLKTKIQEILVKDSNKKIKNALSQIIPSAMVEAVLVMAKINADTPNHSVRTEERKVLVKTLKTIPLNVSGLLGKDKAVVSSGGVALNEIDFKTMQSKVVEGVFVVGDVLNIDRPSGGYSLQLCWTTGFVAGDSC